MNAGEQVKYSSTVLCGFRRSFHIRECHKEVREMVISWILWTWLMDRTPFAMTFLAEQPSGCTSYKRVMQGSGSSILLLLDQWLPSTVRLPGHGVNVRGWNQLSQQAIYIYDVCMHLLDHLPVSWVPVPFFLCIYTFTCKPICALCN